MSKLYLIPTPLGEQDLNKIIPDFNLDVVKCIRHFIVEDLRTARRFLKKIDATFDIDSCTFFLLNEHTPTEEIKKYIQPLIDGHVMAVMSEAGCPAVADPGSDVVTLAQNLDLEVVPLVGPSSILLSLMASGFNGQNFAFNGYLPVKPEERVKAIKRLESKSYVENQTQIFIETPYRNDKLVQDLVRTCQPDTKLCIAVDITLESQWIKTKSIKKWKSNMPEITKRPCIFLISKP